MEVLGAGIFFLLACLMTALIMLMVYSVLLLLTAAMAKIEDRSLGKAILSTFCAFVASIILGFTLGMIPFLGWIISFIASLIIPVLITQGIFNTTFTKALIAEILRMAIISIIAFLIVITFMGLIGFEAIQQGFADVLQNFA